MQKSLLLPGLATDIGVADEDHDSPDTVRRLPTMYGSGQEPDDNVIADMYAKAERIKQRSKEGITLLRDVLDISSVLTDGATAMVDDSFLRCFASRTPDPWNWNFYLFPCWVLGCLFRYLILFPLRIVSLVIANAGIILLLTLVYCCMPRGPTRKAMERRLAQAMCWAFLMSWSAVIRYHGPMPVAAANRVWVANHTSMIDYAILNSYRPFAVIMQLQGGWVRFIQTYVMGPLGCLWFDRTDIKDRQVVGQRMKAHVSSAESTPLLIFPEGTCVNNEYTVLFKRGAFDMGCTVCPIAIKYNKVFVDAFWNSKRLTFGKYILRIMASWALVCDVWFLEPQNQLDGETPDEFASRVQKMIADKAGLRVVPWDGYLKYYNYAERNPGLIEKRRKVWADGVRKYLPHEGSRQEVGGGEASAHVNFNSNGLAQQEAEEEESDGAAVVAGSGSSVGSWQKGKGAGSRRSSRQAALKGNAGATAG